MKKLKDEKFYSSVFNFLAILLFGGLFLAGIVYTGHNPEIYDEFVVLEFNNPLLILAFILIGTVFLFLAALLYDKILKKIPGNILLGIFMAAGLILALSYAWTTATEAQADALSLAKVASEINAGIAEPYAVDSYIGVYSHQLGFVTVLRVFFKLFGDFNYKAIQTVFAFLVPLMMLSGSQIIRILLKTRKELAGKCEFFYLLLMFCCLPMYMYVLFVYGDILYTALTLVAAWIMLSTFDRFAWWKAFLFGLICGFEYLCKSNSLIVFVALAIVMIISSIDKGKRKSSLSMLVFMLVFILALPKINDSMYKNLMPNSKAMPSIAWIGMGMNDDYGRAGWHNYYNQIAFEAADYDADKTKVLVLHDIRAVLGVWAHNPLYMLDFLNRKANRQWNAPLYQGIVMNNSFKAELQSGIGAWVYANPSVQLFLEHFMKIYQICMYGFVFLGLILGRKEKKPIMYYCLLIAVFGGFLFSLMWEAKTRYIFPYLMMTIPYFAINVAVVFDKFRGGHRNV